MEVAVELVDLAGIKAGPGALGFDEDDDLSVALDSVIHFFTLLVPTSTVYSGTTMRGSKVSYRALEETAR